MTATQNRSRSSKPSSRRRPRLRVARPPRSHRRRRLPFLVACFLVVGSLVVGVVSMQALLAQTSFQMQELMRKRNELAQAAGRLQLQIAQLSAPDRISEEARRLGYRLPSPGQLHTLPVRTRP